MNLPFEGVRVETSDDDLVIVPPQLAIKIPLFRDPGSPTQLIDYVCRLPISTWNLNQILYWVDNRLNLNVPPELQPHFYSQFDTRFYLHNAHSLDDLKLGALFMGLRSLVVSIEIAQRMLPL